MKWVSAALWSAVAAVVVVVGEGDDVDDMAVFVPEVLTEVPKSALKLTVGEKEISFGTEVTPTEAKAAPGVAWDADADALYALCLTNPDIPTAEQHIYGELVHWLVVNIPGGDVDAGDHVREYLSPGPPKQTGTHRYVFLVFKQPGRVDFDEPRNNATTLDDRFHFSVQKFAEKYHFELPAVAGNYFQAAWDPTVDEMAEIRTFKGQIVATIHP